MKNVNMKAARTKKDLNQQQETIKSEASSCIRNQFKH